VEKTVRRAEGMPAVTLRNDEGDIGADVPAAAAWTRLVWPVVIGAAYNELERSNLDLILHHL
jgi:hypothetical protein